MPHRSLLLVLFVSACVRIEDGPPKHADSTAPLTPDTSQSAISDPSLRPQDQSTDPATAIRGTPQAAIDAFKNDTVVMLSVIDSAPIAQPNESDMDVLRREMIVPVAGVAREALHDTFNELRGGTRSHEALDILAPRGTPVIAATSGRVLKLFNSKAGGLMVYAADSSDRFILMYGHLDAYAPGLADGQAIKQGQQLGTVGTTGNAPPGTPHLHFAIARSSDTKQWYKGSPVNPYPLLAK